MLKIGGSVGRKKESSGETKVRPITQLVGVSKDRARRHRSVPRWAQKHREGDLYREVKGERLQNACRDCSVSMINAVARLDDSSGRLVSGKARKSEVDCFLDGVAGSRIASLSFVRTPILRGSPVQLTKGFSS